MTYTPDNSKRLPAIPDATTRRHINLGRDTGALLAAIPTMLGFRPENSMVFLGLSEPGGGTDRPPGLSGTSSEVGPVVRSDLDTAAVVAAVRAMTEATRDRQERKVIIVVIGGGAEPLVARACREFLARGTEPLAGFTVTDLQAGGLWWEIAVRGAGPEEDDHWASGELPDPTASPVLDPQGEPPHFPDQEEFDGLLDPVRVPDELRDTLPGSWRRTMSEGSWNGRTPGDAGGTGDGGDATVAGVGGPAEGLCHTGDVAAVCALVDDLHRHAARKNTTRVIHRLLGLEGVPELLADACFRDDLMPVLVVLSTGPAGRTVRDLLTGIATLARGPLRYRALVLLAVACWCGSGGALANRAARRARVEITRLADRDPAVGPGYASDPGSGRLSLTLDLAHEILDAGETGKPAPFITNLVDLGEHLIALTAAHCPAACQDEFQETLDRILDPGKVTLVRSELARRAER
ncbi:DUF4192 domain-containing protein [Corynebacterium terpenotabidum]|uniref:DUF4192 domain-containing protein n=1 Tax=Corynebacterium terpenotabidum TaxID=89154 RepID=UPI0009FC3CE5|nr:DUF4192 domain-containing protein [Corynebacterium terpenotabidum]